MRLSGDDLEIGIKEEGKAFSGLSDVLTIKNWRNPNNRIETIRFTNGDITAQNLTGYLTFGDEGQNFTWTESAADLSLGSGNDTITTGNYGDTVITYGRYFRTSFALFKKFNGQVNYNERRTYYKRFVQ